MHPKRPLVSTRRDREIVNRRSSCVVSVLLSSCQWVCFPAKFFSVWIIVCPLILCQLSHWVCLNGLCILRNSSNKKGTKLVVLSCLVPAGRMKPRWSFSILFCHHNPSWRSSLTHDELTRRDTQRSDCWRWVIGGHGARFADSRRSDCALLCRCHTQPGGGMATPPWASGEISFPVLLHF